MTPARRYLPALSTLLLAFLVLSFLPPVAFATCTAPKNAIEAENCLPGTPASQWYVAGTGSPNIQGFATDISVNVGQTIFFKISTSAVSYRIDIYRLGGVMEKTRRRSGSGSGKNEHLEPRVASYLQSLTETPN
jgi:hypothetical protein